MCVGTNPVWTQHFSNRAHAVNNNCIFPRTCPVQHERNAHHVKTLKLHLPNTVFLLWTTANKGRCEPAHRAKHTERQHICSRCKSSSFFMLCVGVFDLVECAHAINGVAPDVGNCCKQTTHTLKPLTTFAKHTHEDTHQREFPETHNEPFQHPMQSRKATRSKRFGGNMGVASRQHHRPNCVSCFPNFCVNEKNGERDRQTGVTCSSQVPLGPGLLGPALVQARPVHNTGR